MKPYLHWTLFACAALLTACAGGTTTPSETKARPQVEEISILELDSLNAALPNAILLDVRSDEEWAAGHLSGASYISFDWDHRLDLLKALPQKTGLFSFTAKPEDEVGLSLKSCVSKDTHASLTFLEAWKHGPKTSGQWCLVRQ